MIYVMRPIDSGKDSDWDPWYDKTFGVVVVARNEKTARLLASEEHGDEGSEVWLDSSKTSCTVISPTDYGVVLREFASA